MKIGEVSKIVGISSSAIRFYERHGMINSKKITRAENGYRVYATQDIEQLLAIKKLKEFGLELKEIKNLLSEDAKTCGDLVSSLDEQLAKCREIEKLVKNRMRLLLAAKNNCNTNCKPTRNLRSCRV